MVKAFLIILSVFSGSLLAQNPDCIPVVTIKESINNSCIGTLITLHATVSNPGTNEVYKWKKNKLDAGANNNFDYTTSNFADGDMVTCEYSCKTKCGVDTIVISNAITIHVINDITPIVTIANNDELICEGELTVFTAKAFYGNATPLYQWMVNGIKVGVNSPVFSTVSITNGARVECVLTFSTPSCPATTRSATSQLTTYVYPMIHPAIKIKTGKTQICRGEEVRFTATANGGAYPTFTWKINGKSTGANASLLETSTLKDGDTISCMITIDQDSRCHTGTSSQSNEIIMLVRDYTYPSLVIKGPTFPFCAGTTVTFNAAAQNGGENNYYQWLINGTGIGSNSPVFTTSELRNRDKVSCILSTNIPGCSMTAIAPSNNETVTVKDVPIITFAPPQIAVMRGDPAQVNAIVTGNTASVLWTPAPALISPKLLSSFTVPLIQETVLNLAIVDSNGCPATKDLVIKVLHKLHMPSAFTPNDDGLNDLFRIPPDASVVLKEFSIYNRWGNVVFRTADITKGWNGTFLGQKVETGTFVYLVKGTVKDEEVTIKGTVTLVR